MSIETTDYDLGARRWHATGETLPDSVLEELRGHDAILLGAVGDPGVPSGVLERGLLLRLRFALDHYVNLRPARLSPGVAVAAVRAVCPGEVDFVVVREGTEGPYTGNGGALRVGTPHEIATEVQRQHGVRRRAGGPGRVRPRRGPAAAQAHAGAQAQRPDPRRRTCGGAPSTRWRPTSPTSTTDYLHVDAATIFLVTDPARFDVIVTDNLFGDILTDLAAAVTGGIGLAASGNVNPDRAAPEHVRAGPRLRPRHRRAGHRRPDGHRAVGRACCSTTSAWTAPPPGSRRRWPRTSRPAARPARRTAEIGDALAAAVSG